MEIDVGPVTYLQNHEVFSSKDLDEVRDSITALCSPHDFDVKGKGLCRSA